MLFKLSVFAFDLVVKPRGENFVLRSEGGAKDFYPALVTIESVHLGFLGHQPGELERTAEHLVTVFGILHAPCVAQPSGAWGEWFSSENSCRRIGLDSDVSDPVADTSSALNRVPPL